jgi:myo-inositol-1-phosphate synthase
MVTLRDIPIEIRELVLVDSFRPAPHHLEDTIIERIDYSILVKGEYLKLVLHVEAIDDVVRSAMVRDVFRALRSCSKRGKHELD